MSYPKVPSRPRGQAKATGERVQSLVGERPGNPEGKAVTVADLSGQGAIAVLSRAASAAPTQAEYNALVADVHSVMAVLNAMGARFTGL